MRALTLLVGFAAIVVVIVASLEGGQEDTIEVDKILHFSGYATLAIIFVMGLHPAYFIPVLILLALMGVAIEFLQPLNSRSREHRWTRCRRGSWTGAANHPAIHPHSTQGNRTAETPPHV